MTATMSCPEIVRRALAEDDPSAMEPTDIERLPSTLKNYLPEGMMPAAALAVHNAFLAATDDKDVGVERIFPAYRRRQPLAHAHR